MVELDLTNADADALKFLQNEGNPPAEPTPAEPAATPAAPPTPESGKPAGPKIAQLGDDDVVELEVGGQKVQKPWKQARQEMMLHSDYTRKRQEESKVVKQAQDILEVAQKREELFQALVSDPRNIVGLLSKVTGKDFSNVLAALEPEPEKGVDELATVKDVIQTLEQVKKEATDRVEEKITQLQTEMFVADVEKTTKTALDALIKEHPELKSFPHYDKVIKTIAREKQAADLDELREALVDAGKQLVEHLAQRDKEKQKESAIQRAELLKKGVEPPGGTPVVAPEKTYGSGNKVDWSAIDKDAEEYLKGRLAK